MNKKVVRIVGVALVAVASAWAQHSQALTARIPFGFHVGTSNLPAGTYTVDNAGAGLLRLRSDDAKSAAIILTHSVQKSEPPVVGKLIFNRYGNDHFLSQVWTPGTYLGSELRKSKRESTALASAERGTELITASK